MGNLLLDILIFLKDKELYKPVDMLTFFLNRKTFDSNSVVGKKVLMELSEGMREQGFVSTYHKPTDETYRHSEWDESVPVNQMTYIGFSLTIKGFLFITDYLRQLDNASFIQRQTESAEISTQSVVDTNKNVRLTNIFIWVSVAASCISAFATCGSYDLSVKTYEKQVLQDTLQKQLVQVRTQLQKDTFHLSFLTHQNDSLKNKIDSLLHVSKNYK